MNLTRCSVLVVLLLGSLSSAQSTAPATDSPRAETASGPGFLTGEQWRYRRTNLLPGLGLRLLADLVAIPTGVGAWREGEWALFAGTVGSTAVLSAGRPSIDVQFHGWLQERVLGVDHFRVWGLVGDLVIWSSAGAATLGLFIYGLLARDEPATETAVLMFEAFAVAQLYHQVIKLLVGRAGPTRPELEGQYLGPAAALKLWPAGTPSGHMASMYAMLSVLMYYFDHPALWVGLNAFAVVFGASLVGDNYHWLSDVTLGAVLGFCVGRWVVQHRSTRYQYGAGHDPVRYSILPVIVPGSGAGAALVVTF